MVTLFLLCASFAGDPGFGGVDDGPDAVAVDVDVDGAAPADEFPGGAAPETTETTTTDPTQPVLVIKEPPKKTKLEIELEKARLDPARFPLIQLRVDVARLELELQELEGKGLTAARDVEPKLAAAKALLADAERIALHRMNVCLARRGIRSQVKNYRMTPAGPVRLGTREMLAQASAVDPDGCVRIELVDQALVDRLKRAHEVRNTLETVNFPYHRIAERRALEDELETLEKELAREDLPVLSAPGATDFQR